MRERMLSFHARYRCQDSGDCCSAGWAIAVEPDRVGQAERAIAEGRLAMAAPVAAGFIRTPGTPPVLAIQNGACVFYRSSGGRCCEIHRALGHAALPLACRRFPRVSVVDPRGVSTSLSHFCPTVRSLLTTCEPAEVVSRQLEPGQAETDPADFGLDMRDSVPPLLRPGMFMDWDAWWLFETLAVDLFERVGSPEDALMQMRAVVESVRGWSVGDGPLAGRVEEAFNSASSAPARNRSQRPSPSQHLGWVMAAIPDALRPHADALAGEPLSARAANRLLMAHAFANWTAHLGHGLRSWLRALESVEALVASGLGAREVDMLLRHLADPGALASAWSHAERE